MTKAKKGASPKKSAMSPAKVSKAMSPAKASKVVMRKQTSNKSPTKSSKRMASMLAGLIPSEGWAGAQTSNTLNRRSSRNEATLEEVKQILT